MGSIIVPYGGNSTATASGTPASQTEDGSGTPITSTGSALDVNIKTGTVSSTTMQNAATASGNGTVLTVTGCATAILQIVSSPSMSGGTTVNFEVSADAGTTWVAVLAHQLGSTGNLGSTTTTDGDFRINCAGFSQLRARISGYSAGTVTVKGYATPVSAQATTVALAAGTQAIGSVISAGDVASAVADSGNPVKFGGLAKTSNPTAVTDGQRVNALFTKTGKQVVVHSLREVRGRQVTTITSSTAETTIVTAGASGVFNDLYGLVLTNTSASATEVTIRDATSGGTISSFYVPPTDTRGFMLSAGDAWPQTTAANNWTATCGSSIASLKITALYVATV